ncbi:metallophosphoesterase family protein [Mucilaginibacter phyllosphaerae]|uniref:Phosphoesterase n=1 Tax=Mucilaginibacter phyllosphaerae TaxID=1812349 RepID=A0A4Y8AHV4_9SPHI|nr:metallophosphoesterase family protein [Mucilaginibacter phyllosphaerae]MBB3968637.1 putative phosphoesterase [Mucilaginibacter phyllosphaerae]TEW67725.1 metallophosphoesterase [Mucilaginibacter phyllosphaerae]GGH14778.1 phosphoesterase [Mucilaginibacter phyllosphaerae]
MKIGVISDIHGNHYALQAVLSSARKIGVEQIFVLGDIVGYYYRPDLILEMLAEWPHQFVRGNHEDILLNLKKGLLDAEELKKKYASGHEQALWRLTEQQQQYLFNLPTQLSVKVNDTTFQLNHGSPRSIDEYLYPDTDTEILESCNSNEHDFVLIGHSHYAFTYQCRHSLLVNSGSVGQSRQKGGAAYWSVIDTDDKSLEMQVTAYDTTALLNDVKTFDPESGYSYKILTRE